MKLTAWVAKEGSGVLSRLQRETGLAYTTVLRAARGEGVTARSAKLIADATAGEVSPAEVLYPDDLARSA